MSNSFVRDADSNLDYQWDWSSWLADGETIDSSDVTADPGIILGVKAADDTTVTQWLSGGTVGESYLVTCRVTTSQGRIDDRSIRLRTTER